ncbi:hypothetical protein ACTNBL_00245 [Enterococcus villorum]|uniref:Lipoprotein n=1 Tax=Enterococcus villorum ATCC 700913 TaxID=1158604 RepID=A0ABN0KIJ6_9ENTE|nr:hypothetical protein [Enterococcus villorum]EOH91572.1 hypothetical protein UAO_00905 [Enterococcus villorum ATCC 700913]EOW76950.1 hypothetical protein I591_02258 [Enterococcus villorum ATCC 700913]
MSSYEEKNIVIFKIFFVLLIVLLSGCKSANQKKIENAELNQVTNGGTLQSRGTYKLKVGTLQIFKEIQLSKNINQDPAKLATSDSEKEQIKKLLANDFTKEDNKPEQNELFQTYNKKIKNCYAQIDEENKKTQENNGEHLRFSVQFI